MALFPDEHETIVGVGRALRAGRTSCVEVLEQCFDRIKEWEPRIKAWVIVDRAGALDQARALDEELAAGKCRGPLHGIPIGIKDIINVKGLPTAAGFRPWKERIAEHDAYLVYSLRDAGAVILGKTVSTQFAWIDPPPTRNPWDLERTPGGSSSGSAAAVAVGMCLAALGTQTGGSIIRPASFCGVAGYKPVHMPAHDVRMLGILPFAPSLDHPGPIARTVADLYLIDGEYWRRPSYPRGTLYTIEEIEAVVEKAVGIWEKSPALVRIRPHFAHSDEEDGLVAQEKPLALIRLRGFFERRADPVVNQAFDHAMDLLARAGAKVVEVPDPFDFEEVIRDHRLIMAAEAAAGHEGRLRKYPEEYQPRIRDLIREGLAIPAAEYIRCQGRRRAISREFRSEFAVRFREFQALVMPATIGPAPDGSTTGDPAFNSPWSYTGDPTVSFPIGLSPNGLPLAMQMVNSGPPHTVHDLFGAAQWCEDVIRRAFRAGARSD